MDPALHLHPEQQALTPDQEAEAKRFAERYIQTQLSTAPVDEEEAEACLWQAYEAAGQTPPRHIHWLDGPLQLVAALAHDPALIFVDDELKERVPHCVWDDALRERREINRLREGSGESVSTSIDWRIMQVHRRAEDRLPKHFQHSSRGIGWGIWESVSCTVWERVREGVGERIWQGVGDSARWSIGSRIRDQVWGREDYSTWHSIRAYDNAPTLALVHFFDTYFAPNEAHGLAHFNQMVSGYWLGKEVALIVRRPKRLALDAEGRLHSETGKCVEYGDGWGFYAWHGVRVPEEVILDPDYLIGLDWRQAENVEVRRVMQERMGERFVSELGGVVLDSSSRGTLYEVALPRDPEQVARYVQVQDASTDRSYFLRVPPTIQTAAEAVAWSFGLSVEDYHPAQET